ncbi:MAG: DedA family protein [Desulfobulbaceae bacterium]|nr:DedA family protein [Desulfobulbaceae bacterium]HIJ79593.1 DedA family protein [Deltaproteobacteria bacterium]
MKETIAVPRKTNIVRAFYDKCMIWSEQPGGVWIMFGLAVAESSFFPIPPDIFLMALCIATPKRSFRHAAICTLGSVLGGVIGYGLGFFFMDTLGRPILDLYGLQNKYLMVQELYRNYDVLAVGAAGFTPLPYKIFTLTAGAFHLDLMTFTLVSLVSRAGRFFLVAALIHRFGAPIRTFIERYFNLLSIVFLVLLVAGYILIKQLL